MVARPTQSTGARWGRKRFIGTRLRTLIVGLWLASLPPRHAKSAQTCCLLLDLRLHNLLHGNQAGQRPLPLEFLGFSFNLFGAALRPHAAAIVEERDGEPPRGALGHVALFTRLRRVTRPKKKRGRPF